MPPGTHQSARLGTGRIETVVARADWSAEALFGFGERINPRRAFLFVSRVLGRHVPVAPSTMRRAFTDLAAKLPVDLPGPILMLGMAETAIGLGAGVHDAWLARTGRGDTVYLATTRTPLGPPLLAQFVEAHSHASGHLVHTPPDPAVAEAVRAARTLVIVDDEASTGRTAANLATALQAAGLGPFQRRVLAVLTDWSGASSAAPAGRPGRRSETPRGFETVSLLAGRHRWQADPAAPLRTLPDADIVRPAPRPGALMPGDARLGRLERSPRPHPAPLLQALVGRPAWAPAAIPTRLGPELGPELSPELGRGAARDIGRVAGRGVGRDAERDVGRGAGRGVGRDAGRGGRRGAARAATQPPWHVLGMGEHVWEPFLMAEALEAAAASAGLGRDVLFSATTRSPILPGHDIARGLSFADHEGLGIRCYVYNVDPVAAGGVLLAADTSLAAIDPGLIRRLGARVALGGAVLGDGAVARHVAAAPPAPWIGSAP
ncbi:MAG: phosphoribosyltransferase domain-containing protein [Pseudomonadota bacterium]